MGRGKHARVQGAVRPGQCRGAEGGPPTAPKIGDFGIARFVNGPAAALTRPGRSSAPASTSIPSALREKANPQADVLVTLPPFIQQADSKGLLQKYAPEGADQVDAADKAANGTWTAVVNN